MLQVLFIIFILCGLAVMTGNSRENSTGANLLSMQTTNSLRGLSILMVLVGHISGTFGTVVFSPMAATGVVIFTFISGFGLNTSWKKKPQTDYWIKKLKRVYLPFVILAIALYAWELFVKGGIIIQHCVTDKEIIGRAVILLVCALHLQMVSGVLRCMPLDVEI